MSGREAKSPSASHISPTNEKKRDKTATQWESLAVQDLRLPPQGRESTHRGLHGTKKTRLGMTVDAKPKKKLAGNTIEICTMSGCKSQRLNTKFEAISRCRHGDFKFAPS